MRLLPWFFLGLAGIIEMVATLMAPGQLTKPVTDQFFRLIIGFMACGWLSDIWTNRDRIKRRFVLMVFVGYYVWTIVTEDWIQCSSAYAVVELGTVFWIVGTILFRGWRHGQHPAK